MAVRDAASLRAAMQGYVKADELAALKAFLGWATVDFLWEAPDAELADAAVKKALAGEKTSAAEDNAVRVFAFTALLERLKAHGIPYQFFFGSEFTPGHGGPAVSAYRPETLLAFGRLLKDHPDAQFDLFIGSILFSQESAILVKMHPNLHVAGVWWHNMYPAYIRRIIAERLDVCPLNKVTAFFSDAYMVEWSYGKWKLVQRELAAVLAERVAMGYLTRNDASEIARRWTWENPAAMYGL